MTDLFDIALAAGIGIGVLVFAQMVVGATRGLKANKARIKR